MEYNVQDHGDILEHEAVDFIRTYIPYYEHVWKTYIGNKGNARKADIPNYAFDEKRQKFSEHTYTVLESSYFLHKISESKIFEKEIATFQSYFEFNNAFISFFTHLGRCNDNLLEASTALGMAQGEVNKIRERLREIYVARNIIIHGKKIPFALDELGLIKIPMISTSDENSAGWNDKISKWGDAPEMKNEYVSDTCEDFLTHLLKVVNNTFALFYEQINEELKQAKSKIKFEYNKSHHEKSMYNITISGSSGSSNDKFDPLKAQEYISGRHGSSGFGGEGK
jgi:hypothetical protein